MAVRAGMTSLVADGMRKVSEGATSPEEIMRILVSDLARRQEGGK